MKKFTEMCKSNSFFFLDLILAIVGCFLCLPSLDQLPNEYIWVVATNRLHKKKLGKKKKNINGLLQWDTKQC